MSFGAYLQDRGWRGPGAPFGGYAQGLGALASYVRDREWRGPGAPFGLGDDPTTFTPDELAALGGPSAGPDALGANGSVSQFFQGIINQASAGTSPGGYSLPTGAQSAAAFPSVPTWAWVAGGVGLALFLGGAFKGGRR